MLHFEKQIKRGQRSDYAESVQSPSQYPSFVLLKEEKNVWRRHLGSCNTWNFLERMIFEELSKEEALVEWFGRK